MKAREYRLAWNELEPELDTLCAAAKDRDADRVIAALRRLVPGYQPAVIEPTKVPA